MPAAACIVELAIVMQFYHPRGWQGWIGVVFWMAVAIAIIDYVRTLLTFQMLRTHSACRDGYKVSASARARSVAAFFEQA